MADLIYTPNVSLDGFIEDDHGSFDFTTPDDDVFAFITGLERSAGTYLYGKRMYETMAVWETDPGLSAPSDLMADFANMWQAADEVVYSTTLEGVATARTRLERGFDADAIRTMKASASGHLTVAGPILPGRRPRSSRAADHRRGHPGPSATAATLVTIRSMSRR